MGVLFSYEVINRIATLASVLVRQFTERHTLVSVLLSTEPWQTLPFEEWSDITQCSRFCTYASSKKPPRDWSGIMTAGRGLDEPNEKFRHWEEWYYPRKAENDSFLSEEVEHSAYTFIAEDTVYEKGHFLVQRSICTERFVAEGSTERYTLGWSYRFKYDGYICGTLTIAYTALERTVKPAILQGIDGVVCSYICKFENKRKEGGADAKG